ncbi:MAG: hypothetical protein BCS36_14185 [Desulfovibrio sp. MES5]|nr:MAG: hypothetical protein BCS36_14185 [Desulfovibrio sp. MES5]
MPAGHSNHFSKDKPALYFPRSTNLTRSASPQTSLKEQTLLYFLQSVRRTSPSPRKRHPQKKEKAACPFTSKRPRKKQK